MGDCGKRKRDGERSILRWESLISQMRDHLLGEIVFPPLILSKTLLRSNIGPDIVTLTNKTDTNTNNCFMLPYLIAL